MLFQLFGVCLLHFPVSTILFNYESPRYFFPTLSFHRFYLIFRDTSLIFFANYISGGKDYEFCPQNYYSFHIRRSKFTYLFSSFDLMSFLSISAELFPGRSDVQCLHRWQKVLNPELVKGTWTNEVHAKSSLLQEIKNFTMIIGCMNESPAVIFQEDDRIVKLVAKHGSKKWSVIAESLPGRIGKQCRERYIMSRTVVVSHMFK